VVMAAAPPIPATQVLPTFSTPAGAAGQWRPAQPPALESPGDLVPPKSSGSRTLPVLGVVALALLCCVISGLWGGWQLGRKVFGIQALATALPTGTQKGGLLPPTPTTGVQQTQTAQAERIYTELTNQRATQTAMVQQTRAAQPTPDEMSIYVNRLESVKNLIFGPDQGKLAHSTGDTFIYDRAKVYVANFIAQATFYNPYSTQTGAWDYGFLLRKTEAGAQYRMILFSDSTWRFVYYNDTGDNTNLAYGSLLNFDTSEGGDNQVRVYFDHTRGMLFVNGAFVATLDLSVHPDSGSVGVATGMMVGNSVEGANTDYEGFTIWALP